RIRHLLPLLAIAALPCAAFAQEMPDQPDWTVDAATRKAVVDSIADRIERLYVFPDKAKETARALRKRLAAHEYDRITSAKEFADSLTLHAQAVSHDLHMRVNYRSEPFAMQSGDGPPPVAEM